jgi:hypothetical protein
MTTFEKETSKKGGSEGFITFKSFKQYGKNMITKIA